MILTHLVSALRTGRRRSLAVAQQIHVHDIRVVDKHQYQLVMDVGGGNEEHVDEKISKQILLYHGR